MNILINSVLIIALTITVCHAQDSQDKKIKEIKDHINIIAKAIEVKKTEIEMLYMATSSLQYQIDVISDSRKEERKSLANK